MKMYYFILILLLIWGAYFFVEPYLMGVEKVNVDLEEDLEGLKIVHLTDLHSRRFGPKEKKLLSKLKELDPDYVFVTGDFIDTRTRNLKSCQEFWEALVEQHPDKVFGVLGNHEHQHSKTEEIISRLERSGIRILNNESLELAFEGSSFVLAGTKDPHTRQADLAKATGGERPDVLLAHSPEIFKEAKGKVDLVLTGHTHGGQVNIPLLRWLVLPLRYGKKYREGLFEEQGSSLYVSKGIGTTILPIRFNAPPEITLIEFK